jgi:hypothetical protein
MAATVLNLSSANNSIIRSGILAVFTALCSGCATIVTPVPPADYQSLNGARTLRVTPTQGRYHEADKVSVRDSTVTIVRPQYPEYETRR